MQEMFAPESLSFVTLPNEMSYQDCKPTSSSFFNINQVSYDSRDLSENLDEEVDNLHFARDIPHAKKFTEDDYGLRLSSIQRGEFAQKYLFKSGLRSNSFALFSDRFAEVVSDEDDYSSDSQCENSGTYQTVASSYPQPLDSSREVSGVNLPIAAINEASDEEEDTYEQVLGQHEQQGEDMFFSCADWETAKENEKMKRNNSIVSDGIFFNSCSKRFSKLAAK